MSLKPINRLKCFMKTESEFKKTDFYTTITALPPKDVKPSSQGSWACLRTYAGTKQGGCDAQPIQHILL